MTAEVSLTPEALMEKVGRSRGTRARRWFARAAAVLLAAACAAPLAAPDASGPGPAAELPARTPDVPYEPTPPAVVQAMLDLGRVGPGDVVYDLGCGDGRIVVAAARRGARGVGVDIDPARVREARANVRAAGLEDRVEIRLGDVFETDVHDASVVMLFLWPEVNLRLRPRLLAQLRPGSRIVSHWHDMGAWRPARTVQVESRPVYLWYVPGAEADPR